MPYTRIVVDTNPWIVIFMTGDWDWNVGDTFQVNEVIGGQVKPYKSGTGWCTQVSFSCVCELVEKNYKKNHQEEYLWESDTEDYLWNV